MSETLKNAPLVEIVAELRWQMPALTAADQSGNQVRLSGSFTDDATMAFFHRVTGAVGKHGFDRLEQLFPSGLPVLLSQMLYRYRRTDERPVLAQVGPGMFSVNALPPYKSWDEFRPMLEGGIEGLLEALADKPDFTVNLRYIDAFKQDLTSGREAKMFATEVLGFGLELPPVLRDCLRNDEQARMSFQVAIPTSGMQLVVTVSDGHLGPEPVVLMNTDIQVEGAQPADKQAILLALDQAHELIHETFMGMTQSIRDKLQPAPAGGRA